MHECYFHCDLNKLPYINNAPPENYEFAAMLSENPKWPRASPLSGRILHETAQILCLQSEVWITLEIQVIIASLLNHFDQSSSELHWCVDEYEPLTMKNWPEGASCKFWYSDMTLPSEIIKSSGEKQSLGPELDTEDNWTSISYKATGRPPMDTVRLNESEEILKKAEHEKNTRATYVEDLISQGGNPGELDTVIPPNDAVVIIPLAILSCVHFIAKQTSLIDLDLYDKAAVRGALRWQLNEVCLSVCQTRSQ